jgi:hypothetical protein
VAAEVPEVGHQSQVLGSREEVVNRGELPGHSDRSAHTGGLRPNIVASHSNYPTICWDQRRKDSNERGLAGAIRAEEGKDRAFFHGEINVVQHTMLAKRLVYAVREDRGSAHAAAHRSSSVRV